MADRMQYLLWHHGKPLGSLRQQTLFCVCCKVLLNLPTNGIQLVAANVVAGQPVNAIDVNKQLVAKLGNGQALYFVDLSERMSGTIPNRGTLDTLSDNINTILL